MAVVNLTVNGRLYEVGCDDSQMAQIRILGDGLDQKASDLSRQLGIQPEGRLLVMVGLMLADELAEAKAALAIALDMVAGMAEGDSEVAACVNEVALRIEAIADRLERT